MWKKKYDVLLHGFLNVILIILARYICRSWYLRFGVSAWFMDTGGRDYWVYKEMHARGGRSGFGMGHALRVWIFFLCIIACRIIQVDPNFLWNFVPGVTFDWSMLKHKFNNSCTYLNLFTPIPLLLRLSNSTICFGGKQMFNCNLTWL